MNSSALMESSRDAVSYSLRSTYPQTYHECVDSYAIAVNKIIKNVLYRTSANPQRVHLTDGQVITTYPSKHRHRSSILPSHHALPEWLLRTQCLLEEGRRDLALKEISLVTTRIKANGGFEKLSSDIQLLDPENFPDIVLIALLRNTYSMRSKLPDWNSLLDQTEALLRRRGSEPRILLRGLKRHS